MTEPVDQSLVDQLVAALLESNVLVFFVAVSDLTKALSIHMNNSFGTQLINNQPHIGTGGDAR